MAPRKSYTRERLDGIAADSAVEMKGLAPNGKVTCEYLHQGVETIVRGADDLSLHWEIEASGYNDQCKVEAKCGNVATRGVPFPERWRTALRQADWSEKVPKMSQNLGHQMSNVNFWAKLKKLSIHPLGKQLLSTTMAQEWYISCVLTLRAMNGLCTEARMRMDHRLRILFKRKTYFAKTL